MIKFFNLIFEHHADDFLVQRQYNSSYFIGYFLLCFPISVSD